MSSIDLLDRFPHKPAKQHWIDRFSRQFVLKLLANIRVGYLTIEEDGQKMGFGNPDCDSQIRARIQVNHMSAYRMVLQNGTVGSGEAYMLNTWQSPDIVQVIRLMVCNLTMLKKMNSRWTFLQKMGNALFHTRRQNDKLGAKRNIAAHYDLGNDFFSTFLDPTMLYSAAIYPTPESSLHEASQFKMQHIGERLNLKPSDHLLEIGSGWGAMAIYAAKHFGCRVTSVTLSKQQWQHATQWVAQEGLEDKVSIELKDYRDIEGQFDKLVSIEMIEAVGHQYYQTFFNTCSKLLKEDGLMLIQAITIVDQRYEYAKNNVDFIQRYIFPGGCLPSISVLNEHIAKNTNMNTIGLEDITFHYAKTLNEWRHQFLINKEAISQQGYDDVFIRMWDFYLAYCEGGFRERAIGTIQLLCAKPQCRRLPKIN